MLRLNNLHVNYGQIPALRALDMSVEAGEIVFDLLCRWKRLREGQRRKKHRKQDDEP